MIGISQLRRIPELSVYVADPLPPQLFFRNLFLWLMHVLVLFILLELDFPVVFIISRGFFYPGRISFAFLLLTSDTVQCLK